MPEFYIRGQQYSLEQIKELTQEKFCLQNITNMPTKLYKYFPNVISADTGINYSQEALINNTVYLQNPTLFDDPYDCTILANEQDFYIKRITYYAERCGIKVQPEWDYNKIVYELSLYLYEGIKRGISLEELFSFKSTPKQLSELRLETFILNVEIGIVDTFKNFNDVWQRSFYNAIQKEYIDDVQNSLKNFRISCFAESPYSILMWSHYANQHKGFCLEYEIPPYSKSNELLFHSIHPVIYSDTRISTLEQHLNYLKLPKMTNEILWDIYKYGLLIKNIDWKYQNEWRLILLDDMLPNNNCKFFKINKVYLGNKMSAEDRWKLIEICNRKEISYGGVSISQEKYKMEDCTQLCENCPKMASMINV